MRRRGSALPEEVHDLLRQCRLTIGTAESLTGGRLASQLAAVPGASASYRGGVVAYATDVKVSVLGVPPEVVADVGVISAECARAMAVGARRLLGCDLAVATTGVAGPDRQDGKPPGTVFVALAGAADDVEVLALELSGSREDIVLATCEEALRAVIERLRR